MFKAIRLSDIIIAPNRQRQEFDAQALADLTDSLRRNGIFHPIVVRRTDGGPQLVAGERRLRAIKDLNELGDKLRMGDTAFEIGFVPCNDLAELSDIDAFEAELEENIRRVDLTWQERAVNTSKLLELRTLQAEKEGRPAPSVADISREVRPDAGSPSNAQNETRSEIIVARHLSDPDVAKAPTHREALKIVKRKEESRKNAALGVSVGLTFSSSEHHLYKGNCITVLRDQILEGTFDVILADPPYGIDAQEFNDSDGKAAGGHFYDDSYDQWILTMRNFLPLAETITKAQSHLYLFCDVENFCDLKALVEEFTTFKTFRTPLVWVNPGATRAPWPDKGPQRKYQCCLYAVKGGRQTLKLAPDVSIFTSDENLGHPAQKPVLLYQDYLSRSCRPGDYVLDAFCGSGTIFPAAHALKIRATGIEMDEAAYGLSVKRLGELK